ncbi:MAG: hypothetical protein A3C79_01095 [Candidatus Taylorbacteria bacterium RIFCSPHIGHO2_02_FULL_45_28]|uniref:Uncharacterized protein n=1 Tax=Candidatus Taylorbacteria bacterium RIFCSPHIGHO2_12_FULL_45_16 TaxID=1802315 RepID=A0A1G2N1R6_9BACT|nr:MAG: hypothetical protein A2830_02345 [Candidatus Taylorbacteria bacterium RIFCSPHIGHO2_01_FULL_44_110]OHA25616.1 MAG: hypothetical protein A3C79_01095 [Candidatus Taylorbacteria bacterium RIFCSPHIGHO2_02_FULL_45_28]OHA29282.1 MAG: hypothetical protein A3F51_01560 [Candidatus Taylorbacteria bacterium RIFCSPHIGHO2_12_FULL_45_16]OHA33504.1 MAG: hypothetical protein A3A23_02440 [Candidatus Taylorbacteria bacterium RIFCSPLOWO2_01_FULL_45_59]OHA39127.1 MAG: hypothetical protein A3I98_00785 [Candi
MGKKVYPHYGPRFRRKSDHRPRRGHHTSVNKYAHLIPERKNEYDPQDKTFRYLPIMGRPNETVKAGLRTIFHGRLYELMENTTIPTGAPNVLGRSDKWEGIGRFKLVAWIDNKK